MTDREKLIELLESIDGESGFRLLGYHDVRRIADHLIANGVTVQRWIPVTERLPEDGNERVLVKIKDANNIIGSPDMDTDRYFDSEWVRWGRFVTHWMPLPEQPKEVE